MALTKSYANTLLKTLFAGAYIGLSTTTPDLDGTGATEPSAESGYDRVSASGGEFTADNGAVSNSGYIYFPEAIAGWGTITHVCVFDMAKNGTLRYFGALTESKEIAVNTVPLFRPNSMNISIEN